MKKSYTFIQVTVTNKTRESLVNLAEINNTTVSSYVNDIIEEHIEKLDKIKEAFEHQVDVAVQKAKQELYEDEENLIAGRPLKYFTKEELIQCIR